MSLRSMTGFARVTRPMGTGEVVVSLKSVNHRALDVHFHLPPELDALESELRVVLKAGVVRGHLQVHVDTGAAAGAAIGLNRPLLDAYMRAFQEAAAAYQIAGQQPDLNAALRLPSMLNTCQGQDPGPETNRAVLEAAAEAVTVLNEFRECEGAAMVREMCQRTQGVVKLVDRMEQIRGGATAAFQRRLRERLADLLHGAGIDPQRLIQEAALAADRSDISEELVRLRTHAEQLERLLGGSGEVGKRLDFLLQEMNREANTVLSKTGGLGDLGLTITDLALAAKSEIDKIREQALNLE
ncbi:MAG: YicC/YloC family endoribonuclease [Bryobacteraceae bacterium]|jgi:uncharacterized protein (TIGR00255 family)